MITATCSFTGFDDNANTTAGEYVLLNPNGGAVALFSTVRAVYSSDNSILTNAVFAHLLRHIDGQRPRLGDIMRKAKNLSAQGADERNTRKFALIGDPSQELAIPIQKVVTHKINGVQTDQFPDTLRAMDPVLIEGFVADQQNQILSDFNGTVTVTLFDKAITLKTLGQDAESSEKSFKLQSNILFRGQATVTDGEFAIEFVIPKDINYEYGAGKLSYYAENGTPIDAYGQYSGVIIGGTNPNAIVDDTPPEVEVFMNNDKFVFGGITNSNPDLYIKLSDDNGINVSGSSIGHDFSAVLDGNQQQAYILNDYYKASPNDFRKGTALFPLKNLESGRHRIDVRAWDVANNLGEGFTEFVVLDKGKLHIAELINYPNPFYDGTRFAFEHNFESNELKVIIPVFDLEGRKLTELNYDLTGTGSRIDELFWDGTSSSGNPLPGGMYLYGVIIEATGDSGEKIKHESEYQKLMIIR